MGAAAAFVAFQLCVAAMLAMSLGFYEPPPFAKYAWAAAFPAMMFVGGSAAWHLRTVPDEPTRHLVRQDWKPHFLFGCAMALMWLQFVALTWMKAMLPLATSMWADPMLANLEASFLGTDAWRLLPGPNMVIEAPYTFWTVILCASFVGVYFRRSDNRETSLLAFFLTVGLLGTFGQYLLPSGGPVFWEKMGYGGRFLDMALTDNVALTAGYLWAAYDGRALDFATGISAFPSIHVATSAWIALAYRHWLGYAYFLAIFFGSIILGWHYALDGIAGAVGALLCYRLAALALKLEIPAIRELAYEKIRGRLGR